MITRRQRVVNGPTIHYIIVGTNLHRFTIVRDGANVFFRKHETLVVLETSDRVYAMWVVNITL